MAKLGFDPDISDSKAHMLPELLEPRSCQYLVTLVFLYDTDTWAPLRPRNSEYPGVDPKF